MALLQRIAPVHFEFRLIPHLLAIGQLCLHGILDDVRLCLGRAVVELGLRYVGFMALISVSLGVLN